MMSDEEINAGKPGFLSVEEWLLARNFEEAEKLNISAGKTRTLLKLLLATSLILFVLVVALEVQVYRRNRQIENVEKIVCSITGIIPDEYNFDRSNCEHLRVEREEQNERERDRLERDQQEDRDDLEREQNR